VREICARYELPYNTGPLHKQFGSEVKKICRLALPGRRHQPADETGGEAAAATERELAISA
jgi:hypothetical protein